MIKIFRLGDRCFSIKDGWGKVTRVDKLYPTRIFVTFDSPRCLNECPFWNDGRVDVVDVFPTLYTRRPKLPGYKKPPDLVKISWGDKNG